jgi:hypothetical protein
MSRADYKNQKVPNDLTTPLANVPFNEVQKKSEEEFMALCTEAERRLTTPAALEQDRRCKAIFHAAAKGTAEQKEISK